ncbi:MAG TPA: signal peptidase I [Gemmatimonadaceae bacterium]
MTPHRLAIATALLGATFVLIFVGYTLFIALDGAPVESFRNVSPGMQQTLLDGDYFTISRRPIAAPQHGQVVAYRWPVDRSKQFVRRIVAIPGDTIAMIRAALVLNGKTVTEPYAWRQDREPDPASDDFLWQRPYVIGTASRDTAGYTPSRNDWGPLVVPNGQYFVLGDNRDNSLDSRYWGFLPKTDILGEARRTYFSRDSTGHIRWLRFGKRIR